MQTDYKKLRIPSRKRPKIQMLKTCFGWSEGDEFVIKMETEGELYFDDAFDRWTAVKKTDEGKEFEYLRKYISPKFPKNSGQ